MHCANCNAELEPNSRFCDSCGNPVSQPSAATATPAMPPQSSFAQTAAAPRMQPSYVPLPGGIRGGIIKVPDATPGIVVVTGQGQKPFQLDASWLSAVAPAVNMIVEVNLDAQGNIATIQQVPDSVLAKEQASVVLNDAGAKGKALARLAAEKVGMPVLISVGLLALSWLFFDYVLIKIPLPFGGGVFPLHLTYWKGLGMFNFAMDAIGNPMELLTNNNVESLKKLDFSTGIYGVLAITCMLLPLLPAVWKDKRAQLGGLGPLAFWLIMFEEGFRLYSRAKEMAQAAMGTAASNPFTEQMIERQTKELQKQISGMYSMGIGFYLSIAVMLFLAYKALSGYFAMKARENYY